MKHAVNLAGLALVTVLVVIFASDSGGQSTPTSAGQTGTANRMIAPPDAAPVNQSTLVVRDVPAVAGAALAATVKLDTKDKLIRFDWRFDAGGKRCYVTQRITVDYWPTAAAALDGSVIVAGKRSDDGSTILERWTYTITQLPDALLPQWSTEPLLHTHEAGRRVVRIMHGAHGVSGAKGAVLLQYADSRDVRLFDVDSGVEQVVFSADTHPSLEASTWRRMWSAEHPTFGYVYVIYADPDTPAANEVLVIRDTDKDGDLDELAKLDHAGWTSLFGTSPNWTKLWD